MLRAKCCRCLGSRPGKDGALPFFNLRLRSPRYNHANAILGVSLSVYCNKFFQATAVAI